MEWIFIHFTIMDRKPNNYQPIENYGIIGNMKTVALVSNKGSIDYMCFPEFDSPSVFAALLDTDKGGFFSLAPTLDDQNYKQLYIPETNVLLTRFLSDKGVSELTDFMPVDDDKDENFLIRRISSVKGDIKYTLICNPHFNYANAGHTIKQISSHHIIFRSEGEDKTAIDLISNIPLHISNNRASAEFALKQGSKADFILRVSREDIKKPLDISGMVSKKLSETINYWKEWSDLNPYTGRWRETVQRSALVLKLMTSSKHGSIIASPTFSLPESIGGERNWDYRYTWIRDASFTIFTLVNLGYKKEAIDFMKWIEKECEDLGNAGTLSLMYTIAGENVMKERTLDYLEGYMNSRPVRIGNDAKNQVQLDIYGELMDSVYLYNKYIEPISYKFWKELSRQIDWLCDNWHQKDEGIWEVRGGKREFLYSRLMCWVALDRSIKIAQSRSFPMDERWIKERNEIFNSIFTDFWNEKLETFVQFKGADNVDAATLLMPLMRIISPRDPMWLSTLKQIEKELVSDSLVFRYRHEEAAFDGMHTGEGTFSMCTFWYIECLSRAGQLEKARLYFEKMLGYANHLGLFAEQLGFRGEHLGNFPQAFTHLGLISAALNLNQNLNDQRNREMKPPEDLSTLKEEDT